MALRADPVIPGAPQEGGGHAAHGNTAAIEMAGDGLRGGGLHRRGMVGCTPGFFLGHMARGAGSGANIARRMDDTPRICMGRMGAAIGAGGHCAAGGHQRDQPRGDEASDARHEACRSTYSRYHLAPLS